MSDADRPATHVAERLAQIRRRMDEAALRAGRQTGEVTLVAVSKTYPLDTIAAAYAAGERHFGENRFEEAADKMVQAAQMGLTGIHWHFIGTVQSRQTPSALRGYHLIHSVDRAKIAHRLSRDAVAAGQTVAVLLEVNVSGERSKHGFSPAELLTVAPELAALPALQIRGLMTMAPFEAASDATRPVFRDLRLLRRELHQRYTAFDWPELSMGMTNDFEVAIEEGATIVRIGSALFGSH